MQILNFNVLFCRRGQHEGFLCNVYLHFPLVFKTLCLNKTMVIDYNLRISSMNSKLTSVVALTEIFLHENQSLKSWNESCSEIFSVQKNVNKKLKTKWLILSLIFTSWFNEMAHIINNFFEFLILISYAIFLFPWLFFQNIMVRILEKLFRLAIETNQSAAKLTFYT